MAAEVDMSKAYVTIGAATADDIPAIHQILSHYVANTVITFRTKSQSEGELLETLEKVRNAGLPYITAKLPSGELVGCTYASAFRSVKLGYRHTVELTIFCHPKYRKLGIGSKLLDALVTALSKPEDYPELTGTVRGEEEKVRQVLAVISYDPETVNEEFDLKKWYERFGFEEVGHLRAVGHKFDRWYVFLSSADRHLLRS